MDTNDIKDPVAGGYLFNITMQLQKTLETEYLDWVQRVYIPEVMTSGFFIKNQLLRIQNDAPDDSMYALQFITADHEAYNRFEINYLDSMVETISHKWANRVLYFTTSMEIVK